MLVPALLVALQAASVLPIKQLEDYNCQAEQGSFDTLELEGSRSSARFAGKLVIEDLGSSNARWLPAAGILFRPVDEKGRVVGLQFWLITKKEMAFGLRQSDSSQPLQLGVLNPNNPIDFDVSLDGEGEPPHRGHHRHLAEILGCGGEVELISCSVWTAKAQAIQLQDALEVGEEHLDLLPLAA